MAGAPAAALRRVLEPVVASAGYDLEDVVVTPAGRRRLVRVIVDKDGGVSLDDVADISHAASDALDEANADALLGGNAYVLEVTSPGVDRPLTEPRHWRRNVGRLVTVHRPDAEPVTARLTAASDESITLDDTQIALAEVTKGVVHVEFNRSEGGGA
jgi:ribosome maturation factor RimP